MQAGANYVGALQLRTLLAGQDADLFSSLAPLLQGYKLLFIVLMAGIGAIILQTQATRLGIVSGLDLARQIRLLLHDCPRHTLLIRWAVLYPIYVLAEIAIIATDLAELLGSAIALNLLFPRLPLWAGVLLTSADVLLVLAFFQGNQNTRKGMFGFELIIVALVLAVFCCFAVLVVKVGPDWGDAFFGYVPSKQVFGPGWVPSSSLFLKSFSTS